MALLDKIKIGTRSEMTLVVTRDMTVGHFVAGMPQVYGTPMMILHMEMASGAAIAPLLPDGYVSVGTAVNIRHLAATPVGQKIRAVARVIEIDGKAVSFEVEAWNEVGKIGDGTHRRGVVNLREFEARYGVIEGAIG